MRSAAIEAAFNLYAKKGNIIAENQMLEILDKLLRLGMTDSEEAVREKVFNCLDFNLKRFSYFEKYLTQT